MATLDACDTALLNVYLRDAQPTSVEFASDPIETERRRVEAVQRLLSLYRGPCKHHQQLRLFFHRQWEIILRAQERDPVKEVTEFFRGKARRGPKGVSEDEKFSRAVAVQDQVDRGLTVEEACRKVGGRSWQRLRDDYYGPKNKWAKERWQRAIRAEISMRALETS